MSSADAFIQELQDAVNERHQANHPLVDKIAAGEAKREAITGAITEHWHWISNLLPEAFYNICSRAPQDVIDMEVENLEEETDPENPHVDLIVRFRRGLRGPPCRAQGRARTADHGIMA